MISPSELDTLKFHWDIWKVESRAFWGRAILGSAILAVSMLFQFGIVTISLEWFHFVPPADPWWFYFFVNVFSWYLLGFLCFKFIDLLRHRVPEKFEEVVHNNRLPVGPVKVNLRALGRIAYLIFPVYVITVACILGYASHALWTGTLPVLTHHQTSSPK